MPAPLGVRSPVHNQLSVRRTCLEKRSDSGWRRRGNRAAQERLHVRRGGLERRRGPVMNVLAQVWQIGSDSAMAGGMAQDGLNQVEIRAIGTHRRH